jgi:hypothetical protein
MNRLYGLCMRMKNTLKNLDRNPERKRPDGRILVLQILKKKCRRVWTGFVWLLMHSHDMCICI